MKTRQSRSPMSRRNVVQLLGLGAGAGLISSLGSRAELLALQSTRGTAPTFPKGAVIRTVLSDIPPEALAGGSTLFHEHLSLTMPEDTRGRGSPPPSAPPPLRLPGGRPLGSIGTYTKDVELMI